MVSESGKIEQPARRRQTDARIAAAVMQLLREGGPDAVTTGAVERLAHVSRATLYRRYTDRFDLMEAVAQQIEAPAIRSFNDGHRLRTIGDLERAIESMLNVYTDQFGLAFMGQLLTSKDESMRSWRTKIAGPSRQALKDAFAKGVAAGDLRDDLNYDRVVELILGAMVVGGTRAEPMPASWAHEVAEVIWPRIARDPYRSS